jgi:hypothetical protein
MSLSKVASGEGALISYLANAIPGRWPYVNHLQGSATPPFAGDPIAFLEHHQQSEKVKEFLTNKVKKCSSCGKPNGFTLSACNSCGSDLTAVAIGTSTNVFMGFVFGIQKGPFPFTVSIRHQCEKALVIDDLLALSPLHFNVIPTTQYIPDWRYLLRRPAEGLQLIDFLLKCCGDATKPFFENQAWCDKVLAQQPNGEKFSLSEIMAGFNYPPSQYQLHIQYMLPVLTPFHYANFLKGIHYTYKRFFPVKYVQQCLKFAAEASPLPAAVLDPNASIESTIEYFEAKFHLSYDKALNDEKNKFQNNARKWANWHPEDFGGTVIEVRGVPKYIRNDDGEEDASVSSDIAGLNNKDRLVLQNYGRPYTVAANGHEAPSGSYYSFCKKPEDVTSW